LGGVLIAVGMVASFATIRINSKSQIRTRFEPVRFQVFDALIFTLSGTLLVGAFLGWFQ
jgi:hypothetical protein